jgi:diguanylate cyclase (GGDEF)-like protein/PAS domain S-box-containing protein
LIVREVSHSAAEAARMSREEMRGRSLRELLTPAYCENLERTLEGRTIEDQGRVSPDLCEEGLWTRVLMLPIRDAAGSVHGGMVIVVDISEEKRASELAEKLAFIDPLTELPNRAMLSVMLSRALAGAKGKRRQLALVWVNLDRFKDVNDALGQRAGDLLLRAVGERLHEFVRTNDLVARVGGDDFLLLLPRINSRDHLERLMGRVHDVFALPFLVQSESVLLSASCGVAVHPDGGSDAAELQEHAHTAMRAAKQLGGGCCEMYESVVAADPGRRLRLHNEIRNGIDMGHFTPHYQPQVHLQTMRVQVVEALARWHHPERGLVQPDEFIVFAEETGLIVPLGRHLLGQACAHLRSWHDALERPPRLAINVSARQFQRTDVCGDIERAAAEVGLTPSALEVEITETAVLADPDHAAEVAARLRDSGATIALDDFGTGYSALTHLRELPIDRVKMDRSFVASCLSDRSAAAILVAITHLAHDLGMEVVAEGVETQAQLDFLRAVGCDAAQGYHLSRPLALDDCTAYLLRAAERPA